MITSMRFEEDMLNTDARQTAMIKRFCSAQESLQLADPFPALAMPAHKGLDGLIRPVKTDQQECLFKSYHHDVLPPYTFSNAVTSYAKAGELGIGPKLIVGDSTTESLIIEYLKDDWRMAVVTDFKDKDLMARLVSTKKTWHQQGRSELDISAFDIFTHYKKVWEASANKVPLPVNTDITLEKMADWMSTIQSAFSAAGYDLGVLHGENTTSNILLSTGKQIALVDFDRTTVSDPMWDLAALSHEVCTDDEDREALLEMYFGQSSKALLARMKLYMLVDDAVWSLWALLGEMNEYRKGPELYKYAANRLIRLRLHVSNFDLSTLIREM